MNVHGIKKLWVTVPLLFVFAALSSCSRQTESPVWQFMPHMATTPNLKAMKGYDGFGNGSSMLMPPEHVVEQNHRPYHYATVEEAEKGIAANARPRTAEVLARGQKIYNIYCIACHGERGHGDGPVVNPFPIPKSLQSADMLRWNDGHLFHVITKGQGVMPSYAQQIQVEDRWAVIHYVRALQRADHPTEADLKAFQQDTEN